MPPVSTAPTRLAWQPALDGLRGVAVIWVLLYHGGVTWARGGFLGVDVFFVLSGYLITALLLAEWQQKGSIDLAAFWTRRARRLLPALLVLLVAVAALAPVLASPSQRSMLRGDGLAALFYVSNWRLVASGQSYFAQFALPSPLRHTWSLAIEEQWYLVWPVAVAAGLRLLRGRTKPLLAGAVALATGSALLMAWLVPASGDPSRVYYGTDTRAQALLAGAVLAMALPLARRTWPRVARLGLQAGGVAAAICLLAMFTMVSDSDRWLFHGGYALAAMAAATVIAASIQPGRGPVRSPLSLRPLRAVGRISYGLYLWHWPLYLALTPDSTGLAGARLLFVRSAATFGAATLSWHLVETPVRRGALRRLPAPTPALTAAAVAVMAAVFLFASPGAVSPSAPLSASAMGGAHDTVAALPAPPVPPTATPGGAAMGASSPAPVAMKDLRILVVGDSVAFSLGYYFRPDLVGGAAAQTKAVLGCGVSGGRTFYGGNALPPNPACDKWPEEWRSGVETFRPNVVAMVIGAWEVFDREVNGRTLKVGTPEWSSYLAGQLEEGLGIVTAGGARLAMLDVPCFAQPRLGLGDGSSERDDPSRIAAVNGVIAAVAARHPQQVATVDLAGFLCPGGRAVEQMNGAELRGDGVHFTQAGAELAWRWLGPQLANVAAGPAGP